MSSNRTLWILQWILGVYFVAIGITHFMVPEGLPDMMGWMYELGDGLHLISGTAEILGGLGLILPGLTKIRPELTVFAAQGLALVMVGALIWHASRGEYQNIGLNVVLAALVIWVAYARMKKTPLEV